MKPYHSIAVAPDLGDAPISGPYSKKVSLLSSNESSRDFEDVLAGWAEAARVGSLTVGLVGTFPPRLCGLATFTADIASSLRTAGDQVLVAALVDDGEEVAAGVTHRYVRGSVESATQVAAAFSRDVDAVLIEHEFGIFGGADGVLLHEFTDRLTVPYVLTLHTVVHRYTESQRDALKLPLLSAALVFVFSEQAVVLLSDQFPGVAERCRVVPHGAPPELYRPRMPQLRGRVGLPADAAVISTFGLLSPGKGVEQAIVAMRSLRHTVKRALLVVAGQTHPDVLRQSGERYRRDLELLAHRHGVDDIVVFRDWFHDINELSSLLITSDVFVTTYTGAEQIVSGALSFAIAAGVPFVSTPYRYALAMSSAGCGITVPFGDANALATAVAGILNDETNRQQMVNRARSVAASMAWPHVGQLIHQLIRHGVDTRTQRRSRSRWITDQKENVDGLLASG